MSHFRSNSIVVVLVMTLLRSSQAASPVDDDFGDGVLGSQWLPPVIDDANTLKIVEQNGRLDVLSAGGGSPNNDAIYLSRFRLSTAANFTIRLDYSFTGFAAPGGAFDALDVVFGVGKDAEGFDSAAIGQGFGPAVLVGAPYSAVTVGHRTNDVATFDVLPTASSYLTGTFELSYDSVGDDLTLRRVGSGVTYTLNDTVRTVWGATDLFVSFGGRGDGFSTTSGQAFVDNFSVVNGTIVPEPACLAAVGVAGIGLLRRRRA